MIRSKLCLALSFVALGLTAAPLLEPRPADEFFDDYRPALAPKAHKLVLKQGDRLAICGDSITEQKMYSRLLEDYLTTCVPELKVTVRQYGWSGEKAPGFLHRMTNDCLRFKPTVATTCYGMNDHEYRPYEDRIGDLYRSNSLAIVRAFKANHVRVIQGAAGCVGKMPHWVKTANGTVDDLNLNLCNLRNIGVEIAEQEKVGFADVYWPMLTNRVWSQKLYGTNYAIAGKDGVHPAWAGHTVMAYAFLKSLGLDGNLGTLTVDLKRGKARATKGHEVLSARRGEYEFKSSRYPFCACVPESESAASYPVCGKDEVSSDASIRSGMTLVPFNEEFNRLMLVVKNATAETYQVSWGDATRTFKGEQLAKGINLAAEFPCNPFCAAFARVDSAVIAKQAFETEQIKKHFHGKDAKDNMERIVSETEARRAPLAAAIPAAFTPVTHTLRIVALN
jgi:lysophospholipase L1-like esterase